ncbi:unnamed protein product [Effrenium voratum]|nr:unnamed protein product [Effrenium voratum]
MCSCGAAPVTPLGEFASAMEGEADGIPMRFPMYTVELATLLEMSRIEPHEELKAKDALVEFHSTMGRAAFVSHQWVTPQHPDPEFKQMRVLQQAIKNMMRGKLRQIPVDQLSEVIDPHAKPLLASSLLAETLFLWYDYFSCPQKTNVTMYDEGNPADGSSLLNAIYSIPAYVDQCTFFFALIPPTQNPSGTDFISPSTWQERGWCRLERTFRELSLQDSSWIIVRSPSDLEIISGTNLSLRFASPVGEGLFSLAEDRWKLRPVLVAVIRRKILSLLRAKDWLGYRSLLNQQAMMLKGLASGSFGPLYFEPIKPNEGDIDFPRVEQFFHQNGFQGIWETDKGGWSPLHYAALGGDPLLVQDLLALKADPNKGTKRTHPDLGFEPGTSPLCICCLFKCNEAAQVLIQAKARVDCGVFFQPLSCAASANNGEAIKFLAEARCNLLQRNAFGINALMTASYSGGLEAIGELFRQAGDAFNPTEAILGFSVWAGAETVGRLVDMKADVNDQFCQMKMVKSTLLHRAFSAVFSLQHRLGRVTSTSTQYYHSPGATPLMMAVMMGNYECAAALIAAGAQLKLRNERGWTAADFARDRSVPEFLSEAFEGRVEECRRVSLLATGWVEMQL